MAMRDDFDGFYTSEQERDLIEKLNALHPYYSRWRLTQARKSHRDLFGQEIKTGETYYKREVGAAWGQDVKLSKRSMARILYSLCGNNHVFEHVAEKLQTAEFERDRRLMDES